jgi:hypothetical protein
MAQRLKPEERRYGGDFHWTQLTAKSLQAYFTPASSPAGLGIPTINMPGRRQR